MKVDQFLRELRSLDEFREQIRHVHRLPRREARFAKLDPALPQTLLAALEMQGIRALYTHQADAIRRAREGQSVVVATSTASGKTLCYLLPILELALDHPASTALLLYPTKALAQDQLRVFQKLGSVEPTLDFLAGTYDGDTPAEMRRRLRNEASFILTNPDMLHQGILPNHHRWARFFKNLRYVVVDEIHTYRGVFGSNVANVFRRLNRICEFHGTRPQFICSSATIANPAELASRLTGADVQLVDQDGSPCGEKKFVLWNPPFLDLLSAERRSPLTDAHHLMVKLVKERTQSIAFTRTRLGAEVISRYCQETLQRYGPSLANAVTAYRSGYLPEERRRIEKRLAEGDLLGVASTNALELGIDIGGMDASLLVGYPGSIASTWQQAGRAGRGREDSVVFLIAQNSPIDQFLMNHSDYLFSRSPENAIVDPDNPHLALGHLRCALRELPLRSNEGQIFGPFTEAMLHLLAESGRARYAAGKWFAAKETFPAAEINLRNVDSVIYTIMESAVGGNRVIGTIDETSAYSQVHDHAVYLHGGETYFTSKLDLDKKIAYVERKDLDYYTQAVSENLIRIDSTEETKAWRRSSLSRGDVTVTTLVTMFKKIKFHSRDSLGYENLSLPPQTLETAALWLVPGVSILGKASQYGLTPMEGLLGISNLMLEVIPLFVMADVQDVGAVVEASNLGQPTVFIFDKYVGGVGYAEKAYELIEEIMQACLQIVKECPCQMGCPSCVGSAHPASVQRGGDAETRDRIPSKEAALVLLHEVLEIPGYVPRLAQMTQATGESVPAVAEVAPIPQKKLPMNLEQKLRRRLK